jgi:hypothetical protein
MVWDLISVLKLNACSRGIRARGVAQGGQGEEMTNKKETKTKIRIKMIIVTKERTRVSIIKKDNLILIRNLKRGFVELKVERR